MNASSTDAMPEDKHNKSGKGEPQEVRWTIVAKMSGITAAEIVVGRLHSEGIPARAWQEGAGEALGLMVGILGTANVGVPEEYADRALDILESEEDVIDYDDE